MLKKILKALLPPIVLQLRYIGRPFYGIKGDFASWEEAEGVLQHEGLQDYAADNILQTVWEAVQTVREGKAEFERDGVLFYEKDYNYPLLAALFYALARLGKAANILDFGGSLGSTYYQNRQILLETGMTVDWNIVEQEKFVKLGRSHLPEIQFFLLSKSSCKQEKPQIFCFCQVCCSTLMSHIDIWNGCSKPNSGIFLSIGLFLILNRIGIVLPFSMFLLQFTKRSILSGCFLKQK